MLVRAAIVFVAAVVLDALWALYIRRSSQGKAFAAASFAAVLLGLGAFNSISVIEDNRMLVPAMVGAFLGTYVTVVLERRQKAGEMAEAVERVIRDTREHPVQLVTAE